jgi:hypothetical protein
MVRFRESAGVKFPVPPDLANCTVHGKGQTSVSMPQSISTADIRSAGWSPISRVPRRQKILLKRPFESSVSTSTGEPSVAVGGSSVKSKVRCFHVSRDLGVTKSHTQIA